MNEHQIKELLSTSASKNWHEICISLTDLDLLCRALATVDRSAPGYAEMMVDRIISGNDLENMELVSACVRLFSEIFSTANNFGREVNNLGREVIIRQLFCKLIPESGHMFDEFRKYLRSGISFRFTSGLFRALSAVDGAAPGYASEMVRRMAAIKPGKPKEGVSVEEHHKAGMVEQLEQLIQIIAEVYVTAGAVNFGLSSFASEPGFMSAKKVKNPEFEALANGIWYAVEVKTPQLIKHAKLRASNPMQFVGRMPHEFRQDFQAGMGLTVTMPRDNPVKDFLVSADKKFEVYSKHRSDAYRILAIVWDDYIQEAVSPLVNKTSGLLTDHSFHKDKHGQPVKYPYIDGVLLIRYSHTIFRAIRDEDYLCESSFMHYHTKSPFPPKVLIQNPDGRILPPEIYEPLHAVPYTDMLGAEYSDDANVILWVGGEEEADDVDLDDP